MNRRLLTMAGCSVAAALALILAVTRVPVAQAKQYDLIGMLKEMLQTNSATQAVNDQIIDALKSVERQAARVKRVDAKLSSLEAGLAVQQATLDRLKGLTADQARLSQQLRDLTATAGTSTAAIAATAHAQAQDLAAMQKATASLAGRMSAVGQVNVDIADKLDAAGTLSDSILADMP